MNRFKKVSALLLAVLMLVPLLLVPVPAAAEEDEENVTEYVLILANTPAQVRNDPGYNRAAAAKLFVDMLPVDNAKLTIFMISNKDTGAGIVWGKGTQAHRYPALRCYQPALNRDHIHDPSTKDRMQCIYKINTYDEVDLSLAGREEIKDMIDWIYHDMPTENSYNDLHCAVYAAMDYLAFNEIKNACMLMIADESTADATWFLREDGTTGDFYWAINNYDDPVNGTNPEGDTSFVNWIKTRNGEIGRQNTDEIPYNWSFNWIDMTTTKFRTENKITTKAYEFFSTLCDSQYILGECHQVENEKAYSKLPEWTVSIMRKFNREIDQLTNVPVVNGVCSFDLDTVFSEVNIAVTGSGLDGVAVKYLSDETPPFEKNISFSSIDAGHTGTIRESGDVWFTCEVDKTIKAFTYANIKLVLPNPGKWTLSFEGPGTEDITVQIVKAQDAEVRLTTESAGTLGADGTYYQVFNNKQPVTFHTSFWYNNRQIRNNTYLTNNMPHTRLYYKLKDSTETNVIEPTLGNGDLVYTFTPLKAGEFTFWTQVERSAYFSTTRNGDHMYRFEFVNTAPHLKDSVRNPMDLTATLDTDVSFAEYLDYFTDEDGEPLQLYMLTVDSYENEKNEQPVKTAAPDGFTYHIPNTKGEYAFSVKAVDPEGAISADKLVINVHVYNEAPALLLEDAPTDEIFLVADVPDILIQAGLFADEDRFASYYYDKLFADADGDALTYEFIMDGNRNDTGDGTMASVTEETDEEGRTRLAIRPTEGAELPMTVTVRAMDQTGSSSPVYTVTVHVNSLINELLARYWWVLAILGAIILIIILLLISRRVHGKWEVTITNPITQESCYHSFSSLAATKNRRLRKTKVSLRDICVFALRKEEADEDKLSVSEMGARNPMLYGTVLPGKCKMEFKPKRTMKVAINDEEKTKGGKIKLRPRQVVTLTFLDEYDNTSLIVVFSFS